MGGRGRRGAQTPGFHPARAHSPVVGQAVAVLQVGAVEPALCLRLGAGGLVLQGPEGLEQAQLGGWGPGAAPLT